MTRPRVKTLPQVSGEPTLDAALDVLHRKAFDLEAKLALLSDVASKLTDELRKASNYALQLNNGRRRNSVVGELVGRVERIEDKCGTCEARILARLETLSEQLGRARAQ